MTDSDLVGRRVAAGLIDVLVVFVLFLLVGFTIGESDTSGSTVGVELGGLATLVWVALAFVYYYGAETCWARTIGKRALGLRDRRAPDPVPDRFHGRSDGGQGPPAARGSRGRHGRRPRLTPCRLQNRLAALAV